MLRARFASLLIPCLFALSAGCGSNDATPAGDAGADAADTRPETSPDTTTPPPDDAGPQRHCALDNGADPVGLCVQKVVFQQWHEAGFAPDLGVAESWDSTTFLPDRDPSGAVLHQVRDDVLYAAAIARYRQSARRYGDTELEATLRADFDLLVPKIEAELTAPPATLDPELYAALRVTASGCRLVDLNDDAAKLDALADAIGASFYDGYYHELGALPPPPSDGGDAALDAGTDAAGDSGGGADSTFDDGADAGPDVPLVDGILGTPAAGGAFAYRPGDAAPAAYALLDLAARHPTDPHVLDWQRAAIATIDHLRRRALEPSTGMLFPALLTGAGAAHDPLDGTDDTLSIDVQASFALALSRAAELATGPAILTPTVREYPFGTAASDAIAATQNAPLWDDTAKGYLAGWSPTTKKTVARKPTRGNALMFAAIHRVYVQSGTPSATYLKPLRIVLLQRTPVGSSLLSAAAGDQASYFREVTPTFGLPDTPARAKSYFSAANAVVSEALDEQWLGLAP